VNASATALQAMRLAHKAKKLFAGKGGDVTGAALCELVALHVAGHIAPDDPEATEELRRMMLEAFVETVQKLVPIVEASEILPRLKEMQQRQRPN
jgi:hypothetical protein